MEEVELNQSTETKNKQCKLNHVKFIALLVNREETSWYTSCYYPISDYAINVLVFVHWNKLVEMITCPFSNV